MTVEQYQHMTGLEDSTAEKHLRLAKLLRQRGVNQWTPAQETIDTLLNLANEMTSWGPSMRSSQLGHAIGMLRRGYLHALPTINLTTSQQFMDMRKQAKFMTQLAPVRKDRRLTMEQLRSVAQRLAGEARSLFILSTVLFARVTSAMRMRHCDLKRSIFDPNALHILDAQGKVAKSLGITNVHATYPPEWADDLRAMMKRSRERIFPRCESLQWKRTQWEKIKTAVRVVSGKRRAGCRSIRRSGIQEMGLRGEDESTIRLFSHHTKKEGLMTYLDHGRFYRKDAMRTIDITRALWQSDLPNSTEQAPSRQDLHTALRNTALSNH